MFQNMKVDVIYYKTNTDFEMEFNLCGCCRMRLLTDKAPDRKTTVYALSRSVARSKIIITVGPLFGEDGVISTIASAIGSRLVVADNSKYAINSTSEIKIIDGSVPLVTSDGFFGGLIIEKGRQTMILLSESKSVRKTVMQELIHPYIAEIYAEELKGNGETPHFTPDLNEESINNNTTEKLQELDEAPLPKEILADKGIGAENILDITGSKVDTVLPDIAPDVISTAGAIGAAKIVDIAGETATSILPDIAPNKDNDDKTAVEVIEESLTVARNDFLAENDPDAAFILDDATDERGVTLKGGEYVFIDNDEGEFAGLDGEDDMKLLGETEENTDEFNMGAEIELVTENEEDDSPIPMEIPELLVEEDEHVGVSPEDFDIPKGLIIDGEENDADFHLPEEQRVLLKDIEPEEKHTEPMKQHIWIEGEDEDFIMDENVGERKISRLNVPILIFSLLLLFIVGIISYFMFIVPMNSGASPSEFIKDIFDTLFG